MVCRDCSHTFINFHSVLLLVSVIDRAIEKTSLVSILFSAIGNPYILFSFSFSIIIIIIIILLLCIIIIIITITRKMVPFKK